MLARAESTIARAAMENRCNGLSSTAIDCSDAAVRMARGRWPEKTAECWAAAAGVQPRMVSYWLARTHKVSADGRLALIRELAS